MYHRKHMDLPRVVLSTPGCPGDWVDSTEAWGSCSCKGLARPQAQWPLVNRITLACVTGKPAVWEAGLENMWKEGLRHRGHWEGPARLSLIPAARLGVSATTGSLVLNFGHRAGLQEGTAFRPGLLAGEPPALCPALHPSHLSFLILFSHF